MNPAGSSFALMKTRSVFPGSTQEHWYSQAGGSITRQESTPRLQDTWFPDYAWSLLFCANERCESTVDSFDSTGLQIKKSTTLGWKFRLFRDPSRPQPLFEFHYSSRILWFDPRTSNQRKSIFFKQSKKWVSWSKKNKNRAELRRAFCCRLSFFIHAPNLQPGER